MSDRERVEYDAYIEQRYGKKATGVGGYTGPDYHTVNARSPNEWDVHSNKGKKLGTYPNAELAHRVRKNADQQAVKAHVKSLQEKRRSSFERYFADLKAEAKQDGAVVDRNEEWRNFKLHNPLGESKK